MKDASVAKLYRHLAKVFSPSIGHDGVYGLAAPRGKIRLQKIMYAIRPLVEEDLAEVAGSTEEAFRLFSRAFEPSRLSVGESYDTYYDSLEGHWGWWARIEGHFVQMPTCQATV